MKQPMITTLVAVLVLTLLSAPVPAVADDDDDDGGGRIRATLRGFSEVPAVSTGASGRFRGTISGNSIEFTLSYNNLEANATAAHIHVGQRDVNGGVVLFLCTNGTPPAGVPAPQPCPLQSGTVTGTLTDANVIAVSTQGIAALELGEIIRAIRSGVAYVNVHTQRSPGGEIRGQVRADDD